MLEEQVVSAFGSFGVWVVVAVASMLPLIEARSAIPLGCAVGVWGAGAMSPWGAALVAFVASSVAGAVVVVVLPSILKWLRERPKLGTIARMLDAFFGKKVEQLFSDSNRKKRSYRRFCKADDQSKEKKGLTSDLAKVRQSEESIICEDMSKKHSKTRRVKSKNAESPSRNKKELRGRGNSTKIFRKGCFLSLLVAAPLPMLGVYSGAGIGVFLGLKWWQNLLSILSGNLVSCLLIVLLCVLFNEFVELILTCVLVVAALVLLWGVVNLFYDLIYKAKVKASNRKNTAG